MATPSRSKIAVSSLLFVLTFLLLSLCSPWARAVEPMRLQVLEDAAGVLSIDEVASDAHAGEFHEVPNGFTAGYTRKVHWFRFTLEPPLHQGAYDVPRRLLLEAQPSYLDDLQLFLPDPARPGHFIRKQTGDIHPFNSRDVAGRNFVFVVDFPEARPQTAYLRLATTSSSLLVLRAWEPARFFSAQSREYALLGLYYGLLIGLLLLNLWHGQWYQNAAYRNFMAYMAALILLMLGMNGLIAEYLTPDTPAFSHHWVSCFVFVSIALGARFHRSILEITRQQPLLNAYFTALAWLPLALAPALLLGYFTEAARVLMLGSALSPFLGVGRSLALLRQHRVGSSFLVLANFASLSGYAYTMLALVGASNGGVAQIHGVQFSSLISLLAFNAVLMSRLRHLQRERNQAQKAAAQAQAAHLAADLVKQRQGALLGMLTHELKTPLGVIRLALDRLGGDAVAQRHAKVAVADISAVVDRCMKADQMDQGMIAVRPSPCDLGELLADLHDASPEPARIHLACPQPLPSLVCDPLLLRTIVANLLDNALKYSPADSTVTIHACPQRSTGGDQPGIMLTVSNLVGSTGLPDPARLYDERYYRGPGAHAKTGSGLGLFIARQLADLLGGALHYIPPSGDDCVRFTFWLPLNTQ